MPRCAIMTGLGVALRRRNVDAFRAAFLLHLRLLLHVKAAEIDRIEQQRREAAIADRIGEDAAGEGEDHRRPVDQQEGLHLFFRDVLEREETGIGKFAMEGDGFAARRRHLDAQDDFPCIAGLFAADIEFDVDLRLVVLLEYGGRVRIFEGKILHILGKDTRLGQVVLRRGAIGGCGCGASFVGHDRQNLLSELQEKPSQTAFARALAGQGAKGNGLARGGWWMHQRRMTVLRFAFALLLVALAGGAALAQDDPPSPHDLALAAGYKAAFICSGLFNAGQSEEQIARDDLSRIYPAYRPLIGNLPVEIDHARRRVSVRFSETMPPRVAIYRPELGCTNLPIGADPDRDWALPALPETLARPDRDEIDALEWPRGDAAAVRELPRPAQSALIAVVENAFDSETYGPETETTAVIVVSNREIVIEQYREGYDMHTPQRTWSVAKSIAATVIGRAVERGLVDLDELAPVPAWQAPGDPRRAITWHNLLHMSSGLWSPTAGNRTDDIYFGGMAVSDSISSLPLEAAPGTRWRYANNDTLLAMRALRNVLGDDEQALAFPFTDLLWRIGMTRTTPETDWQGNYIMSSQVWTTARDLARLGLLYLNDGVWEGERLLPEGWTDYVATPPPAQPGRSDGVGYGAQFWLFGEEQGLPEGTYAAMGNRGQYVVIVPTRNIVVVRRGFDPVGEGRNFDIAGFTRDVLAAFNN